MQRMPMILSGLLALQVAGAIALALTGPDYGAFEASESLVAFDPGAVTEVAIDESGGESVVLRRQEDGWTLPGLHDFPADGAKVSGLLERLKALKKGLPVAVSGSAPKRFKLTEDDHERRVVLRGAGETLGEVLFGTSPSYRQVHARAPGDDAVYNVAFATYDAGTRPEDWMDRDFLNVPESEIARVELPSLALVRADNGLVVEGLGEDEETIKDEASRLLRKLARPGFTAVEGKGEAALARIGEPDLTVTLKRKDDTTLTYRLRRIEDTEAYLLSSSEHDYLFRVPKYSVQAILEASREKLVKPKATDTKADDAKTGEAASEGKSPS
ncbi:MAG: DUF4340 domain-containing protein [Kiloniellaceae bacterium]